MTEPVPPVGPGPRDTERRRITVMFADITGFTSLAEESGAERTYDVITGCLKLLDGIARRHGGSVDKYLGDAIMAVFGLPLALEEAPRAAVNAAIEMKRRVREYNRDRQLDPPLEIHIGINTGLAISGDVSGPVLREFAVMGDPVNVASRLKDLAPPGSVYVGAETWRQTQDAFDYRELDPLPLKGKKQNVRAFALESERVRLHRSRGRASASIFSELVGREKELAALLKALGQARTGRGSALALLGGAGLGKSRLVDELLRTPAAAATTQLIGRSLAMGRTLSFHLFADLLRGWAGAHEKTEEESRRALADALAEHGLERDELAFPVLASLMGLALERDERERLRVLGEGHDPEALENTVQRVMRQLLERLASASPLLIIFEDLYWADASSVQLIEALLPLVGEHPIVFLLVTRPGFTETGERLRRGAAEALGDRYRELTLQPLRASDTRALLRNLCGGGRVPPELIARIEDKASGNPFYIEEVVRVLLAQGDLMRDDAGIHAVRSSSEVVIPDTIHDVILSRIDQLPRPERHLLQRAAIIGRQFHTEVLAAMADDDEMPQELSDLERHQLARPQDRHGRIWEFVHPLIQEVAHDSILESKREELHRAAAEAIEAKLTDAQPGYHGMLAYHYLLGRSLDRAQEYLKLAGDEATQLAAADEALFFFEEAAKLLVERTGDDVDPAAHAELERNIARARANRGDMSEATLHINRALRLLGESVPEGGLPLAWRTARGVLSLLRALYLPRGRRKSAADEKHRTIVELMFSRARCQIIEDPRFLFDSFQTFKKLWEVDPESVEGASLVVSGMVGPLSYASGASAPLGARMIELARPLVRDQVTERFFFEFMNFLQTMLSGDWDDAHEIEAALTFDALEHGVLWDVTNYLGLLVEKQTFQGRFDEAGRWLDEIGKIADVYRYDLARSTHRAQTTFLLLERGELPSARTAATEYFTHHPELSLSLLALGARSKVRTLQGDLEGAAEDLASAEQILESRQLVPPYHGTSVRRSQLLHAVAELDAARGGVDPAGAKSRAARAAAAARAALKSVRGFAARRPEVYRLEGSRRWLGGDRRRAQRWWERSLETADALGARPEWARTRLEIGRRLAEEGDEDGARPHLAAADEVFVALGLDWDQQQVGLAGLDLGPLP